MPNPYFNLSSPEKAPSVSLLQKLISMLIWIAGFNEHILRQFCPRHERDVAIKIGLVAVVALIFNAGLFAIAGHGLFGSEHFAIGISIAAFAIALIIATIESYGGTLHVPEGNKDLRQNGLVFSQSQKRTGLLSTFAAYRLAIVMLTAPVTVTGVGLFGYAKDIAAYQSTNAQEKDLGIRQRANQDYDVVLKRDNEAMNTQAALVADLEREDKRLRQEVVRRSVAGMRRDSGGASPVDKAQLEKFTKRLDDEKSKLASLREQSLKRVEGRNAAVTKMIAASPERSQSQDGIIGRLAALHSIVAENPSSIVLVVALDILVALLDCSGWLVRACAASVYAQHVAKTHILESVAQAKDCADRLSRYERETRPDPDGNPPKAPGAMPLAGSPPNPPTPSNDNHARANDNDRRRTIANGAAQPRRGRGRPRKNGLNGSAQEPSS